MKLQFLTFWAINGPLEVQKLQSQLDDMKRLGFDGVIFHPRYYPGTPAYLGEEYLHILTETILYAKELKLTFWIYDENGWPSGNGDGRVLKQFPDSQCQWLVLKDGKVHLESRLGFNTLCRDEMRYFVEAIYDGYRTGLSPDAFEYVTGFFSDEVGFLDGHGASVDKGGIPWCEEAAERVQRELGHFDPQQLFVCGAQSAETRSHYWQALTDVLAQSFYQTINEWCKRWGKRYTAHLKGEENIFFQIPYSGSCFQNLCQVNTPAVDALERYPGNQFYPRIASSLARHFGDGLCLCESLGGSGWGLTPHDTENFIDWLAGCGINLFVFHLWQYERNSASVRDWPPNIPWGMSWCEAMPAVFRRLREKWNDHDRHPATLLVAPVRGCMEVFDPREAMVLNEHNGAGVPDTPAGLISQRFSALAEQLHHSGLDFDVTEERLLEEWGQCTDGVLQLGQAVYHRVIFADGCRMSNDSWLTLPFALRADETAWHFKGLTGLNQFPLSWDAAGAAHVHCAQPLTGLSILLLDQVHELRVNGQALIGESTEDGWRFSMPDELYALEGLNISIIPLSAGESKPFAFLQGRFLVKNQYPLQAAGERQWIAEDAFYLVPDSDEADCNDLVASGFPFCKCAASVTALRYVNARGMLCLGKVEADAVLLHLPDGCEKWVWGPEWQVKTELPEGLHPVTAELYPSTFNTYGPHHHYQGDRHLTSPDQYKGKKNFADSPDAPDCTLVPQWHLVRFGIY